MARYTDDTINQIKQDVSLERLVVSQGYKLKKHGKDYSLSCPFHEDKTASLVITPSKNLFNCFGCGVSGSVIDWVMKTQGVSFRHAVEILSGDIPSLAAEVKESKRSTVPKLKSPLSDSKDHQAVLNDYQYQREMKTLKPLATSENVIEYIEVTLSDIEQANRLAHEVPGRSLDELPQQTRKLLQLVYQMVREACKKEQFEQQNYRFSRKQIRDATGWGNTQLKVHLGRLEDMEYLLIHRGSRGNGIAYELRYSSDGRAVGLTCGGCHNPDQYGLTAQGSIGRLELPDGRIIDSWPRSHDFVHIDEDGRLSPVLIDVFLPIRQAGFGQVMSEL